MQAKSTKRNATSDSTKALRGATEPSRPASGPKGPDDIASKLRTSTAASGGIARDTLQKSLYVHCYAARSLLTKRSLGLTESRRKAQPPLAKENGLIAARPAVAPKVLPKTGSREGAVIRKPASLTSSPSKSLPKKAEPAREVHSVSAREPSSRPKKPPHVAEVELAVPNLEDDLSMVRLQHVAERSGLSPAKRSHLLHDLL